MRQQGTDTLRLDRQPATKAVGARLRVLATLAGARRVVETVGDELRRAGWSGGERHDVVLAVDEAVQNAVEHGSVPEEPVDVRVEADPGRARVLIADRGRPGRRTPVGEPTPPDISDVRGRGRVIMAALADEVSWRPRGEGTEVELLFRRDP